LTFSPAGSTGVKKGDPAGSPFPFLVVGCRRNGSLTPDGVVGASTAVGAAQVRELATVALIDIAAAMDEGLKPQTGAHTIDQSTTGGWHSTTWRCRVRQPT
jgi:hypothetical protein